jgi:hypothetical protein
MTTEMKIVDLAAAREEKDRERHLRRLRLLSEAINEMHKFSTVAEIAETLRSVHRPNWRVDLSLK